MFRDEVQNEMFGVGSIISFGEGANYLIVQPESNKKFVNILCLKNFNIIGSIISVAAPGFLTMEEANTLVLTIRRNTMKYNGVEPKYIPAGIRNLNVEEIYHVQPE